MYPYIVILFTNNFKIKLFCVKINLIIFIYKCQLYFIINNKVYQLKVNIINN